ncbi:MAG: hypothetical protein EON59_04760 [Alphaproteobacteria bacterium]|nr:MAG: hypothetical protein EON59_04760 [Alphaproteobacteria bacterium]
MSGPQFMHIETYPISVSKLRKKREVARAQEGKGMDLKLNVEEICGEADRTPGHCPHVLDPRPPVLLFGIPPSEVPVLLAERVAAANLAIKEKKAAMARGTRKTGPRAIRPDTHTLLTMVVSYPVPWRDADTGEPNFADPESAALLARWRDLNLAWVKAKADALGFDLVSAVEHEDEPYPHDHFIGIPRNERMEARGCHPGYAAQETLERHAGEDDKAFKKRMNAAYQIAMRGFQDDYYTSVGLDAGLLRVGPKRARLPKGVYQQEKAAGRARGLASAHVQHLAQETEESRKELERTSELLAAVNDDAAQAVVQTSEFERERDWVEAELKEKRAEEASIEALRQHRETLVVEIDRETAALEAARKERLNVEAEAARVRKETENDRVRATQEREELAAQWRDLRQAEQTFLEKEKRLALEVADEREAVANSQLQLDSMVEGIVAYAEGRLVLNGKDTDKPLALRSGPDGVDEDLVSRLLVVKPRLLPIIQSLDRAMSERAAKLQKAIAAAISGWSRGLVRGVGEVGDDGRPTFHIPNSPAGDRLRKLIQPFRGAVAQVISVLPEWSAVHAVKTALARLRPRLDQIEQEEASLLAANLDLLHKRSAELD